jgi:hypothetical protein
VAASVPTSTGRQGSELRDTRQHRSLPHQGVRVQSRGTHGSPWLHMWLFVFSLGLYAGHLVCRILTVAPGPTSGEVADLQVGQLSAFAPGHLEFSPW